MRAKNDAKWFGENHLIYVVTCLGKHECPTTSEMELPQFTTTGVEHISAVKRFKPLALRK